MQQASPYGIIITFYSYKGGTGRSMAVANLGYLLATDSLYERKNVLVIDWDLEAPGLERFFFRDFRRKLGLSLSDSDYGQKLKEAPGLIDFFWEANQFYRRKFPEGGLPEKTAATTAARTAFDDVMERSPLDRYLLQVEGAKSLYLLKAGAETQSGDSGQSANPQDWEYSQRVQRFDWPDFYLRYGSFFTLLRARLMKTYGYVLIDSRTGLTDTAGICTRVMPDKLVGVFVPNRQNIDGLSDFLRKSAEYRRDSRNPKPLVMYPLASRIDAGNSKLRTLWRTGGSWAGEHIEGYQPVFEKLLKEIYELDECNLGDYFGKTQIPHDADFAFGERLAVRDPTSQLDDLSIPAALQNFAKRLVFLATPWEALPDPAKRAEEAKRKEEEAKQQAEEARRLTAAALQETEEAKRKAEEQAKRAEQLARRSTWLWRISAALIALALVGYSGWSAWKNTVSGQRYELNRTAAKLVERPGISVESLAAWARAQTLWGNSEGASTALKTINASRESSAKVEALTEVALTWSIVGQPGRASDALQKAEQFISQTKEIVDRDRAYIILTRAEIKLGQKESAVSHLKNVAPMLPDGRQPFLDMLLQMAILWRALGQSVEGDTLVKQIEDSGQLVGMFPTSDWNTSRAILWARYGDTKRAEDLARGITNARERVLALTEVAFARLYAGEIDGAAVLASEIKEEAQEAASAGSLLFQPAAHPAWGYNRPMLVPTGQTGFSPVHRFLTSDAPFSQSVEQRAPMRRAPSERNYPARGLAAQGPPSRASQRDAILLRCADALARIGEAYFLAGNRDAGRTLISGAEQIVARATDNRDSVLLQIVRAWTRVQVSANAEKIASTIKAKDLSPWKWAFVATSRAEDGRPEEAEGLVEQISIPALRADVLRSIAVAYCRKKGFKKAIEATEKQLDDSSRLATYASVLATWKALGDERVVQFEAQRAKDRAWADVRGPSLTVLISLTKTRP